MTSCGKLRRSYSTFVVLLCLSPTVLAQRPNPIGPIEGTGEVFVNANALQGGATLFAGDTVRTGPGGNAGVIVPGRGTILLSGDSEVAFPAALRYFASVKKGSVGLRTQAGARNFQIEILNFVVVPSPEVDASAEIHRAPDGSAQVSCVSGSVGVIALEGDQSLFLQPGQVAVIMPDGSIRRGAPTPPEPGPAKQPTPGKPPPSAKSGGGRKVGLIVLVAGGAGAAVALAGRKGKASGGTPVSPSVP